MMNTQEEVFKLIDEREREREIFDRASYSSSSAENDDVLNVSASLFLLSRLAAEQKRKEALPIPSSEKTKNIDTSHQD